MNYESIMNDAIYLEALSIPRDNFFSPVKRCYFCGEGCDDNDSQLIHGKIIHNECVKSIEEEGEDPEEEIAKLIEWANFNLKKR